MKRLLWPLLPVLLLCASLQASDRVTARLEKGNLTFSVQHLPHRAKLDRDPRATASHLVLACKGTDTVFAANLSFHPEVYEVADSPLVAEVDLPEGLIYDSLRIVETPVSWQEQPLALLPFGAGPVHQVVIQPPPPSLFAANAPAWPFEKIQETGPDSQRLVFVVMGDGYTASEMGKFAQDVQSFFTGFFNLPPWDTLKNAANIYRVDVTSQQSGADHPERQPAVYVNTVLNATYNCSGIQRLICVNTSTASQIANSVATANVVIVLVNDPEYGGSGGSIAVSSTHSAGPEILAHEVGHSFARLADEYSDAYPGFPAGDSEPNVSYAYGFNLASIKWNAWIPAGTPLPTPATTQYQNTVGMFEGARYLTSGIYRPMQSCKMRYLNVPFCPVCGESHILRFYAKVDPVDSVTPLAGGALTLNGPAAFDIQTLPFSTIGVNWSLGSQELTGSSAQAWHSRVVLSPSLLLEGGSRTLTALISDQTSLVRMDGGNVTKQTLSWNVTFPLYDLNGDGQLNAPDLLLHASLLAGNVSSFPSGLSPDIDGDGETNILDLLALQLWLAQH